MESTITKPYIKQIFKKSGVNSGIYYDKNIDKFFKYTCNKYFSNKLKEYEYPFKNILKIYSSCNYYTFRDHIHDVKSKLNAISGMFSLHELTVTTYYDLNTNEELIQSATDLGNVIEDMNNFVNEQITKMQDEHTKSEYVYQILITTIPFIKHLPVTIIDDNLQNIYIEDAYMTVKKILDAIRNVEEGIILTLDTNKTQNTHNTNNTHNILIKLVSTGQLYHSVEYKLAVK